MIRAAFVLLATLIAFLALARLSYAASYTDPRDGVACDVYRVGSREVNVCRYDGCTAGDCQ